MEYQIILNDDRKLVAVHRPDLEPDNVAQVIGIEKQRGLFKYIGVYFGEADITSMGDWLATRRFLPTGWPSNQ